MEQASEQLELARLLAWMGAMGADSAIDEQAVDWQERPDHPPPPATRFVTAAPSRDPVAPDRQQANRTPPSASPPAAAARPSSPAAAQSYSDPPLDSDDAIAEAQRLANAANDLAGLETALAGFDGCPLKRTARKLCFRRGADQACLMVIGEGPGREEDETGRPFVGRAGQLLDRMLAAIGHDEANSHITNVVYWRPPGNRTPTDLETIVCRPFLDRQITFVDPDVILLLGGAAAKAILDIKSGIMRSRGRWHDVEVAGRSRKVMATLHPAYLLRTPAAKKMAWEDLRKVHRQLAGS